MDRRLWIIFLIIFINFLGFGIILPLLPYYAESLGAKPLTIGLLSTAFSLFQFFAAPVLGELSDKIGRRPVLLFSLLGTVVSFFLLGIAHTILILFIARIVDGASGGNVSTAQAYIADITDKKNRTQGMGIMTAASSLGMILGPAAGGILSRFGYDIPAFLAGLVALLAAILTYFFLPESHNVRSTNKKSKRKLFNIKDFYDAVTHPLVGMIIVVYFLILLAFTLMQGTFALYTEHSLHFSAQSNGYYFAYLGIVGILIQVFFLKRILSRFTEVRTASWGVVSMALAFLSLLCGNSIYFVLVAITLMALGQSISLPVITGLISKLTPEEEQGNIMGVSQSIGSVGRLIGPALGTFMYGQAGVKSPYIFASLILLIAACLCFYKLEPVKADGVSN